MKTKEISDSEYRDILMKELDGINNIELLILKGHILIEYSLNKFINDVNDGEVDIDQTNFTFYNKILVAEFLGLFKNKDHLRENLININKLRNQIAHKLFYEEELLKRIIEKYVALNIFGSEIEKNKPDFENFYFIIISICGLTIGKKMGAQKIKQFTFHKMKSLADEDQEKLRLEFDKFSVSSSI